MKHILTTVDFSDVTDGLIKTTMMLARGLQADVCLLHVEPPEPEFIGYDPGPQNVRDQVAGEIRTHNRQLEELADRLRAEGLEVKALIFQGYAVEKVLEEARRLPADLIVMGSHGHGALYDLLVGRVSEGVLKKAPCPVVIVPSSAASR